MSLWHLAFDYGALEPGDNIVVFGTGFTSKIKSGDTFEDPVDEAYEHRCP